MSRRENDNQSSINSWIPVFIMLFVCWPIGLIMLYSKNKRSTASGKEKRRGVSGTGLLLILMGILMLQGSGDAVGIFALLGGAAVFGYSRYMKARQRMYEKYKNVIGERKTVPISALSLMMNIPFDQVKRDVGRMIDEGYFGEHAYIDNRSNLFVADSRFAPEESFESAPNRQDEEQPAAEEAACAAQPEEEFPDNRIEREFEGKLNQIRMANLAVKDEKVSEKITRIEKITANIFELVSKRPEKADQIHTFMNYYLPTTLKLLDSYSLLERQSAQGENILSARRNIEKMMDQLVWAFEQQLDQMFESEARDISTDIRVLETMMARDGLSENPYVLPRRSRPEEAAARQEQEK